MTTINIQDIQGLMKKAESFPKLIFGMAAIPIPLLFTDCFKDDGLA